MSFYNSPEAWAGRAIAAIVGIIAVILFVGPIFLLKAHNLAKDDAAKPKPDEPPPSSGRSG